MSTMKNIIDKIPGIAPEKIEDTVPKSDKPKKMLVYQLRYKVGPRQVETGSIEASSQDSAVSMGRKWCKEHQAKYISCRDEFLARESD